MEGLRLRVKDLHLDRGELIVRQAKGGKDRVTMLPGTLGVPLRAHLTRLREWYEEERRRARPGVSLPLLAVSFPFGGAVSGPPERSAGATSPAREKYSARGSVRRT